MSTQKMDPKTEVGGLNQLRFENKTLPVFACTEAGVRCHVSILDKYLSKLPPFAFEKDWFYMEPLGTYVTTDPSKHWYACQQCGENKLSKMVKDMFGKIGIEVRRIIVSGQRVPQRCFRLVYQRRLFKNALVTAP